MIEQAVLIGAAAWRLTSLVGRERGPLDIFLRFRILFGIEHGENGEPSTWPENFAARILTCPWCLSLWMIGIVYGIWKIESALVMLGAAAAVAMLLQRYIYEGEGD